MSCDRNNSFRTKVGFTARSLVSYVMGLGFAVPMFSCSGKKLEVC